MNASNHHGRTGRWAREPLIRSKPNRTAGTLYRTADGVAGTSGGIPLTSADRAVVAAVRMAYRVAEAQVDRSARLAKRLRHAGDEIIGPGSNTQALDATERLVFRGMMSALSWIEAAASSERGSPLKRLAAAELQMLGSMLGLETSAMPQAPAVRAAEGRANSPEDRSMASAPVQAPIPGGRSLEIVNTSRDRRAVRVVLFEVRGTAAATIPVMFYHAERIASRPLAGALELIGKREARLTLDTPRLAPTGSWRAAICSDDGLQLGVIDIIL